jgi:Tfp pilus assembly protein PilF
MDLSELSEMAGPRRPAGVLNIRYAPLQRHLAVAAGFVILTFGFVRLAAQAPAAGDAPAVSSLLLTVEGKVEVAPAGTLTWAPGKASQPLQVGDRVRTGPRSRATLRLSNLTVLRVNELTTLEIRPAAAGAQPTLDLKQGATYFFNRERSAEMQFRTPLASGAIRGTEFHLLVAENGRTVVTLLDGEVGLSNDQGQIALRSGDQGVVEPGQAPARTAAIETLNVIQWVLYYPAVLDPEDAGLGDPEKQALAESLSAYRRGDLLQAAALYPENRQPATDAERIYRAALLLAVGQVAQTEAALGGLATSSPLAQALRKVIAAVKLKSFESVGGPLNTATEWLAESYYQQSHRQLDAALAAARRATERSPRFGFAWARVAELEFSFGRTGAALDAVGRGLELSPRHAPGLALKGFLLAAQNKVAAAQQFFEQAIAADGALANAWLGRGLTRIHRGQAEAGRGDLQVAATLEPNRAVLRSYLGKAFSHTKETVRAEKELALAQKFDPNDPTAWLYSALLRQQQNRVNEGIRDLEKSQELNDNRAVYRSRLLLDQDRAVRGANLASLYRDAGMTDLSRREASRAVNADYANYSAHLFLANSYDALRDPRAINLRYETPWLTELLVANLLAPVGAGNLSQNVSQQEYARLFEGNHFGVSSSTEYLSSGDWTEKGSQYGVLGNFSYALDAYHRSERGQRRNNDLEQTAYSVKLKQQLTPADSVLVQAVWADSETGDVAQYYNHSGTRRNGGGTIIAPTNDLTMRVRERQEPILFVGYHREWAPGSHTLALVGRLVDTLQLTGTVVVPNFLINGAGVPLAPIPPSQRRLQFENDFEAYSAEAQHIWQQHPFTLVAGARYQSGDSDLTATLRAATGAPIPTNQNLSACLERFNVYSYAYWQSCAAFQLIGGLSYDTLRFPENYSLAPFSAAQRTKDQVSPKVGFYLTPWKDTTLRGAWTRSLGGLFYDTSVRLEPTQIGGFNQAFRSIIPESAPGGGLVAGSRFETFGLALDQRFKTGTYVSFAAELLRSESDRVKGIFLKPLGPAAEQISGTREEVTFEERSLSLTVNQLVGRDWAFGARYRVAQADLLDRFVALPAALQTPLNLDVVSTLHEAELFASYACPCGFFARAEALWYSQANRGYATDLPGDNFWQFNFFAGYRFLRRQAEVAVGLLNVGDQDYALNPLTLYRELPRERTFAGRIQFYF